MKIYQQIQNSKNAEFNLIVSCGSKDEKSGQIGISHLLEHMNLAFAKQTSHWINVSGYTTYEYTQYCIKCKNSLSDVKKVIGFDYLNRLPVNKVLVEFLRVNGWIKKWFPDLDYQKYVLRQSGYWHLPLEEKIRILEKIHLPLTVCEDVTEHYEYWKQHINPNPQDCCNLRR